MAYLKSTPLKFGGSIVDDLVPHVRWGSDVVNGTTPVTVVPMAALSLLSSTSIADPSALVLVNGLLVGLSRSQAHGISRPAPASRGGQLQR